MLARNETTPVWEAYVFSVRLSAYLRHMADEIDLAAGGADRALPIRERWPTLMRVSSELRSIARLMEYEVIASDEQ